MSPILTTAPSPSVVLSSFSVMRKLRQKEGMHLVPNTASGLSGWQCEVIQHTAEQGDYPASLVLSVVWTVAVSSMGSCPESRPFPTSEV